MSSNSFSTRAADLTGPIVRFAAVTPSDDETLELGLSRGIYVGTGGAIAVEDQHGGVVTFLSADSQYHPLRVIRVLFSGTTAEDIVALY